jgi:preprotein translocase subunit SecG
LTGRKGGEHVSLSRRTLWITGALVAVAVIAVVLLVVYSGGGGGGGGGGGY